MYIVKAGSLNTRIIVVHNAGLINQCFADNDSAACNGSGNDVTDMRDFSFQAVRLLQGVGATTSFALNSTACDVSVHLYSLVLLLSVAVLGYVVAEFQLRRRSWRAREPSSSKSELST